MRATSVAALFLLAGCSMPPPTIRSTAIVGRGRAIEEVSNACPNAAQLLSTAGYPRQAAVTGIERGSVTMAFDVSPSGDVQNISVVNATNPIFAETAIATVSRFKCLPVSEVLHLRIGFGYVLR